MLGGKGDAWRGHISLTQLKVGKPLWGPGVFPWGKFYSSLQFATSSFYLYQMRIDGNFPSSGEAVLSRTQPHECLLMRRRQSQCIQWARSSTCFAEPYEWLRKQDLPQTLFFVIEEVPERLAFTASVQASRRVPFISFSLKRKKQKWVAINC